MDLERKSKQKDTNVSKILKLKYDQNFESYREVQISEHKTENPSPEKPLKRTLFLTNLPPWINEKALEKIFSTVGKVTKIYLR